VASGAARVVDSRAMYLPIKVADRSSIELPVLWVHQSVHVLRNISYVTVDVLTILGCDRTSFLLTKCI
jgi:hypothetical protein